MSRLNSPTQTCCHVLFVTGYCVPLVMCVRDLHWLALAEAEYWLDGSPDVGRVGNLGNTTVFRLFRHEICWNASPRLCPNVITLRPSHSSSAVCLGHCAKPCIVWYSERMDVEWYSMHTSFQPSVFAIENQVLQKWINISLYCIQTHSITLFYISVQFRQAHSRLLKMWSYT